MLLAIYLQFTTCLFIILAIHLSLSMSQWRAQLNTLNNLHKNCHLVGARHRAEVRDGAQARARPRGSWWTQRCVCVWFSHWNFCIKVFSCSWNFDEHCYQSNFFVVSCGRARNIFSVFVLLLSSACWCLSSQHTVKLDRRIITFANPALLGIIHCRYFCLNKLVLVTQMICQFCFKQT